MDKKSDSVIVEAETQKNKQKQTGKCVDEIKEKSEPFWTKVTRPN